MAATKSEYQKHWETDTPRIPVSMTSPSKWALVVVCDDGSMWGISHLEMNPPKVDQWKELTPVPGSRRWKEIKKE